ncbi:hypothetical protein D3C85_827850 [compost metagenome]
MASPARARPPRLPSASGARITRHPAAIDRTTRQPTADRMATHRHRRKPSVLQCPPRPTIQARSQIAFDQSPLPDSVPAHRERRRIGAASQVVRSIVPQPRTQWFGYRVDAGKATVRCATSCIVPWATADPLLARSTLAPLAAMACAVDDRSVTTCSRASRTSRCPSRRPSGRASFSLRDLVAVRRQNASLQDVPLACLGIAFDISGQTQTALPLRHLNCDPVPTAVDAQAVAAQALAG